MRLNKKTDRDVFSVSVTKRAFLDHSSRIVTFACRRFGVDWYFRAAVVIIMHARYLRSVLEFHFRREFRLCRAVSFGRVVPQAGCVVP